MPNSDADRFPVRSSLELAFGGDGSGIVVIREHDRRPDEDTVLEHSGLVHEGVVLQLAVVAHDDTRTHVSSPTDDASSSQPSSLADLSKRPDRGAVTQDDVVSNFSTSVNGHEISLRSGRLADGAQSPTTRCTPGRRRTHNLASHGHRTHQVGRRLSAALTGKVRGTVRAVGLLRKNHSPCHAWFAHTELGKSMDWHIVHVSRRNLVIRPGRKSSVIDIPEFERLHVDIAIVSTVCR
jgi:hypothetical protein